MSPQFFDNADLFLNSVKTCNRSHYLKIDTQEQLETNNLKAFQEIKIDIAEGHTAFCVSVKERSF